MDNNEKIVEEVYVSDLFNGLCFVFTVLLVGVYYIIKFIKNQFGLWEMGDEILSGKSPAILILTNLVPLAIRYRPGNPVMLSAIKRIVQVLHLSVVGVAILANVLLLWPGYARLDPALVRKMSAALTEKCRPYAVDLKLDKENEDYTQEISDMQVYRRSRLKDIMEENHVNTSLHDSYFAAINRLAADSLLLLCSQLGNAQEITLSLEQINDGRLRVDLKDWLKQMGITPGVQIVKMIRDVAVKVSTLQIYLESMNESHKTLHVLPIWLHPPYSDKGYPQIKFIIKNQES